MNIYAAETYLMFGFTSPESFVRFFPQCACIIVNKGGYFTRFQLQSVHRLLTQFLPYYHLLEQ